MPFLKTRLSRWDSVAVITAIVIGVGIFRVPAEVAKFLKSPALMLLAWFLGGIISLLGALCYAELSSSLPKTGGSYVYLRESYGKWAAFLFGWTEVLVIRAGSIAAIAFISAEYLRSLLAIDIFFIKPLAIFIVIAISLINIFGLSCGKKIHNLLTVINIFALLSMILCGVIFQKGNISHFYPAPFALDKNILSLLGLALIPILWTYGGWHENTFVAEETKDAARTLPQALIIGVSLITVLYLAVNFLYIYLMPVTEMANSSLIGSDVFYILYGTGGRKIFEAVVVMASLGSINAMIITGSRITYAMAKDNAVFAYLEKINTPYGTPHRAIIINAVWVSILILLGTFAKLLFFTGILVWLFFALAVAGIFILRRKFPAIKRPYKVWGYPATPAIFILVCAVLFVNTLIFNPLPSLAGLCLLASGIPVYFVSKFLENKKKQ
ncbi:MAG: amino acid permease [Candidatus Omnitrophica bacterium]|nr:amino acid permease [Candidatus Omnitrophota bacterium]